MISKYMVGYQFEGDPHKVYFVDAESEQEAVDHVQQALVTGVKLLWVTSFPPYGGRVSRIKPLEWEPPTGGRWVVK